MIKSIDSTEEGGGSCAQPGVVVKISGNETDAQCKEIAWQMMCNAHPVEAHAHDPDRFWKYFHARAPHVTREEMTATLKECEQPEIESPTADSQQQPVRRLGRFKMAGSLLNKPELMLPIMANFVVLRCEYLYCSQEAAYVAYSPLFEECPEHTEPPHYDIVVTKDGDKLTVTASRLKSPTAEELLTHRRCDVGASNDQAYVQRVVRVCPPTTEERQKLPCDKCGEQIGSTGSIMVCEAMGTTYISLCECVKCL